MSIIILMAMIFCHIVDDYYLQGCLAKFKQKQWWKDNVKNYEMYKYDYIIALIMHGFSWSFMIHLPILLYVWSINGINNNFSCVYVLLVLYHTLFHALIDNEKANKLTINLVKDQLLHIFQILISWFVLFYLLLLIGG